MSPIHLIISSLSAALSPADAPPDQAIVVTAAREPLRQEDSTVSTSLLQETVIDGLNLPQAANLLTLLPGVAVSVSGPPGSQVQVRIRGAEANHSLLFVDGIRFNDPAAGNEARFELLTGDLLSRIELVRGPQSALWGSEALGGVVAVQTAAAGEDQVAAIAEYGSHDSARLSGSFAVDLGRVALSGTGGLLRSDGIDAFGSGRERDGFSNRSGSVKAVYAPSPGAEFGLVGHWTAGQSEFDGLSPLTFLRADTLDETSNRIAAGRAWGRIGWGSAAPWTLSFGASLLDSSNRNRLGHEPLNRTAGRRTVVDVQLSKAFEAAGAVHRPVLAADFQAESFKARDQQYLGATDQDRSRSVASFIAGWRSEWSNLLVTDLSFRHDKFSAFADATTARASVLVSVAAGLDIHGAYGEGIAQPTFYDLHGFFPGSFVGNPALQPERSRSWEAGLRWTDDRTSLVLAAFTAKLRNEIVDVFDPVTLLSSAENSSGTSKRRGLEVEARHRTAGGGILGASYTLLDADQQHVEGTALVREIRRPRHSASAFATVPIGSFTAGASLAYVGARTDTDFESIPARPVGLGAYLLSSLTLGWKVSSRLEVYGRVENGFDADYEDAYGYETPGRTIYAGIRLHPGN